MTHDRRSARRSTSAGSPRRSSWRSRPAPDLRLLIDRETEILLLIARGLANQEVVDTLAISIKTVRTHIGNLLAKLLARDRAQLVAACESGLAGPRHR
ncbi:helix-turn-helix transcriptional regulator [Actinoplanes oblitus]|uniref:Helix-turn-helix transcriptional regulator n=1 Tax=Actinoplanes oblitus TaxID=3040509 RepID=A0ABY8WBD4_9ACTN|nr:helix-turn-helix transcriptional regulator [Actinoplanes oblitus]WIM95184.1 helix-turn-helix transcriptional regulator [Actinoplanes oblitus]